MKNRILNTFVFLLIINLTGYAQDITCRGIIIDANTNLPLQDVRIYSDNTLTLSRENGEFQMPPLKAGSKLILKKSGYAWYVLRVTNNDMQQVKLVPSDPQNLDLSIGGRPSDESNLEVYFDGRLVPKAEWADALSADRNEVYVDDVVLNLKGVSTFRLRTK